MFILFINLGCITNPVSSDLAKPLAFKEWVDNELIDLYNKEIQINKEVV